MGKISLFIFFSSFILGCNVSIAQKIQAKYKSVQIQNSEWLIFNETPKVFNNGDSIALGNSKSAFNPFTNQQIPKMYLGGYNVFEFCGTENYKNVCPVGYHVPTDHDISLIQHLTDTVLGKKHSEKCDKTAPCDKLIELSHGIPNLIYAILKKQGITLNFRLNLWFPSLIVNVNVKIVRTLVTNTKKIVGNVKGRDGLLVRKILLALCVMGLVSILIMMIQLF